MRAIMAAAAGMAIMLAVPAGAVVVSGSGNAQVQVRGQLGDTGFDESASDFGSDSLLAEVSLTRFLGDGLGNSTTITGLSRVSSTMIAPGRGQINLVQELAVDTVLETSTDVALLSSAEAGGTYNYFFTTNAPSLFTLDYAVETSGDGAKGPLSLFSFLDDGLNGPALLMTDPLFGGSNGRLTLMLDAGSYRLAVQDFTSNAAESFGFPSTRVDGSFSFAVAAVPEPGSWAMMLAGFGLTGSALRRRRPQAA